MHSKFLSLFLQTQQTKQNKNPLSPSMDDKVEWSELPIELWPKIGKSLENSIDVLRLRSVCNSWRSSIPPSHPNSPSFPLKIPHPINPSIDTYLNQATLYCVDPCDASSNSKGWLIKVEGSENNHLRLLCPISDRKVTHYLPIRLNLLKCRVFELCKSHTIQGNGRFCADVNKVVFFPNSSWIDVEDSVACCIFQEGKLGIVKHGDEKWTLVDDKNFYYDDVVVCKGQFYVTDKRGTISWVDISSLKLIQCSPPLCGSGNKKHLVESCGSIYVVDRYYESIWCPDRDGAVECFKVYKLDEELGTWVDVKNLGDRVFILGNSCNFSFSAKEVNGYQGNCIYFTNMFDVHMLNLEDDSIITDMFDVRMYNLENHSITTIDLDPAIEKFVWYHRS